MMDGFPRSKRLKSRIVYTYALLVMVVKNIFISLPTQVIKGIRLRYLDQNAEKKL